MNERNAIRDLSDDELSRWIAEKLEPKSALTPATAYVSMWGLHKGTTCWRTERNAASLKIDDWVQWQPRDMVNDAAMMAMLMESGISVQVEPMPRDDEAKFCAYKLETEISVQHNVLGRAVAEASALANGWEAK